MFQSSFAECNPFGCPNPPAGVACTPFGCPSSAQNNPPQAPSQPLILVPDKSSGGSSDGIVSCVQRLLYKNVEVCTRTNFSGTRCLGEWETRQVRTQISENAAVQACQNAR